MNQLLLVLAVALTVGAIVFGVIALLGGDDKGLQPVEPDGRALPLPSSRPLVEADVSEVRFDTAWRGYRMAQVDAALQRLSYDIGYKDELIKVLHAEVDALREGRFPDAEVLRRAREAALAQVEPVAAPVPPVHEQQSDGPASDEPDAGGSPTDEPASDEPDAEGPGTTGPAAEELAAGTIEQPTAETAEEPAEEPADEPAGQPADEAGEQPTAEEPTEAPAEEIAEQPADEAGEQPTGEPEPAAGETADGREPAPPGTGQTAISSGQR